MSIDDGLAMTVTSPRVASSPPARCLRRSRLAASSRRLSIAAGRELALDDEAYQPEAATNLRNRGIAKLFEGYGRMHFDALEAAGVCTRQCSLNVTAQDLAVMG